MIDTSAAAIAGGCVVVGSRRGSYRDSSKPGEPARLYEHYERLGCEVVSSTASGGEDRSHGAGARTRVWCFGCWCATAIANRGRYGRAGAVLLSGSILKRSTLTASAIDFQRSLALRSRPTVREAEE